MIAGLIIDGRQSDGKVLSVKPADHQEYQVLRQLGIAGYLARQLGDGEHARAEYCLAALNFIGGCSG